MGVFTFHVCQGCGWDEVQNQSCSLKADANGDGAVTQQEAFSYAGGKAKADNPWQTAMVWPASCTWYAPFRP